MNRKIKLVFACLVCFATFGAACNSEVKNDNSHVVTDEIAENRPVKKLLSDFEEKLNYVRNGRFTYIFAFTRKDGKPFDSDTKEYVKKSSDPQTNQWIITEDEKTVIAGSNFRFQPNHFEALLKMFKVEDFSGTEKGTKGIEITKIPKTDTTNKK